MNVGRVMGVATGCVVLALGACGRAGPEGPPTIRLGRDECGECGMIISEDRCSCALIVERGGEREYVVFDDIGCMLDHERDHGADERVVGGFVHDHGSRAWVGMASAWYVLVAKGDDVRTPMGSGLIAFGQREEAERASAGGRGEVMGRGGAVEARERWRAARGQATTGGR